MPTKDIAEYGLTFFVVAGVLWWAAKALEARRNASSAVQPTSLDPLKLVIENNTQALCRLTEAVSDLKDAILPQLAKQDVKLDLLLSKASMSVGAPGREGESR
ncbi:MAG TPA: hypothetical protein GXX40_05755 [Firmicutes bacterium]|nr:hypothetical protein [Bacillota bacterium]